jgi:YebC/PmpR family DNA-binding regulatory protein
LVEALTDNRNRTGGDVRACFTKRGGNFGTSGSVAWQFSRKAVLRVPSEGISEDELMLAVLDAGAESMERVDDVFEVRGAPESLPELQRAVEDAGFASSSSEVAYFANEPVPVDEETGQKIAGLLEALEENDDVQNVYTNADFPEGFGG